MAVNNAFAIPPAVCNKEGGYIRNDDLIKLVDMNCEESKTTCSFVLAASVTFDGRDFKSFVLLKKEKEDLALHLKLDSIINGNDMETSFHGTKDVLKGVEVHAVYEIKEGYALHSVFDVGSQL